MRSATLLKLAFVVFFDMFVAIGIALAALPFYLAEFGASAEAMGISLMLFSLMQFILVPIWGGISDRIGRKRVLVIQQLGALAGITIVALAPSLPFIFAGRMIAGAFGGTMMLTSAYVTDVTTEEKRTKAMGILGVALMTGGLMIGPAAAGALAHLGLRVPFFAGSAMAAMNCIFIALVIDEPNQHTSTHVTVSRAALKEATADPRTRNAVLLNALSFGGIAAFQTCFSFYLGKKFDLKAEQVGPLLGILGVTGIISQASVGFLGRKLGESRVVVISGTLVALASIVVSRAPSLAVIIPATVVFGFCQSTLIPSLLSLASLGAPARLRGTALGIFYGMQSLVLVIAPPLHGVLYDRVGIGVPFVAATVLFAVVAVLARVFRWQPLSG